MDYMEIGPTPAEEDCQQVGTETYSYEKARKECNQFIIAIRRTLGNEPVGARLAIKSFPHDFGSYMEVVCKYDENNEGAMEYAFKCESDAPSQWSKEDREVLGILPEGARGD